MLPHKIKAFQLFIDGNGYPGMVSGVSLPKLSRKFEEYRADIMNGPVEIDLGNEKMQSGFTFEEYHADLLAKWGVCNHAGVKFDLKASEETDNCLGAGVRIVMWGRYREYDFGDLEPGKGNKLKAQISLSHFEYWRDGVELVYIDHESGVERARGVDRTKERRARIGLDY